ncbi:MAG: polysaccharide deacetylase family protein [Oscillospiraceae bacterium]|nr:polysaccharide deacetylase family protein [Oscillospiraceae bacterium]
MRRFLALMLSMSFLVLPAEAAADTKYAALTFDDGPSGKYTRQLLDGLYDRGVQATFLLCGYRMQEYPDITQRIFDEGHEIGYHGYSHKNMKGLSRRDIAQELLDSQALLPEGCSPVFLRPPGGCCSDAVVQVAQARQLAILSWSVDPRDWATQDEKAIETAVLGKIQDGDIVLLHDMTASSVRAALDIVDALLEEDFELVTVSELVRLRGLKPKPGQTYACFPKKETEVK